MTEEDAIRILDIAYSNFKQNHKSGVLGVAFFGGEPTLNYKVIRAVVEHANKNNYKCSFGITTNLVILTDEMIEFFDDNDIHIMVSIDGTKEIHDKNRCGSYDVVANNVKRLIEAGMVRLVEARMTLPPQEIYAMFDGVKNIIDLGIDNINPFFTTDSQWNKDQFLTLLVETEKLINYTIELAEDATNKRNISIKTVEDLIMNCFQYDHKDAIPCAFGGNAFVSFDTNGDMMPCHQRHYISNKQDDLVIGNVLTDTIVEKNILGKTKPHSWCSEIETLNCVTCEAYNICRGWCPSENIDSRQDASITPAIICYYNLAMVQLIPHYQNKILNAKNLRSHQLNKLKFNLCVMEKLKDLKRLEITTNEFMCKVIEFQSILTTEEHLLLPSFRARITDEFLELKQIITAIKEVK